MNTKLTRVLLIEDNPGDIRLVREMLKEAAAGQHNLDCADRLSAGLDYLAKQHPDIVLLDLGLPDSQGLDTLARVHGLAAGIPIVVFTVLDDEAVGIEAVRQGAQDYLVKGQINGRVLRRVINYAIERKKAEEALRKAEEKYFTLVERGNDGIIIIQDALLAFVNSQMVKMTGFSLEEALGKPFISFVAPEYRELVLSRYKKRMAGEEVPARYEMEILAKDGGRVPVEVNASVIEYEGRPADMAIIRDITERKQAEEALKESEEWFSKAFHHSPIAMTIARLPEGRCVDINDSFLHMLEYTREEVIGHTSAELNMYANPDERAQMSRVFSEEGRVHNYEFTVRTKTGKLLTVLSSSENFRFRGQDHIISMNVDITERKQAEDAIRRSEENFRRSLDNSPLGIRIVSADGETLYANRAILDTYGYDSIEEVEATPREKRYTPESYAEHQMRKEKRQRGEYVSPDYGISIVCKNGEIRHLEVFRKEVLWDGKAQFQMLYHDITDHKKAEEARKASEEKYRRLFEKAVAGVFRSTLQGTILDCNEAFARIFGYASREEVLAESAWDLYFEREDRQSYNERLRERGSVAGDELRLRRKDGQAVYVLTNASLVESPEGKLEVIEGTLVDITERKKMEEKLRTAEENFRNSLDNSPLGIRIATQQGELLYANQAILDITGCSSVTELRALSAEQRYTPESYAEHLKRVEARRRGQPIPSNYTISIVHKDGKIRHLNVFRKEVIWNGEVQSQGIYEDITERKQAEEEVKNLAKFPSENPNPTLRLNQEGIILYANPASQAVLEDWGCAVGSRAPAPWVKIVNEALSSQVAKLVDTKCGERFYAFSVVPIKDAGYVNLYGGDITYRRKMQEALQESEEHFRRLAENAPDVITRYEVSPQRRMAYISPAITNISGYSPEDFYTDPNLIFKIVHPDDLNLLQEVTSGKKLSWEVLTLRWVHKNGSIIWTEQRTVPIYDEAGKLIAIEGVARDITERKKADEDFRRISAFNQSLLDSLPFGMDIVDETGTILYLGKRLESMLGKGAIGKKCWDILKDNRKQCDNCPWKGEIKIGEVKTIEVSGVLAGRVFQVAHTGIMYQGKKALLKILNDITERKQAEETLTAKTTELSKKVQELEGVNRLNVQILNDRAGVFAEVEDAKNELQAIVDALTSAIVVVDEDRRILRANQSFAQLVGKPIKEVLGEKVCRLVHGTDKPIADCPMERTRSTGKITSTQFLVPHRGRKLLDCRTFLVAGAEKPHFVHRFRVVS